MVFGVLALTFQANQVASGLALTIFGIGVSAYIGLDYTSVALDGIDPIYLPVISDIPLLGAVTVPEVTRGHVFHQYTVRIHGGRRDAVRARLDDAGIGTMVYYPIPIHQLPVYESTYRDLKLPVTERTAGEVLSIPIWPEIDLPTQERVVAALRDAMTG